ncbi:DUF6059 family protein [Streptomyces sp. NPDC060006]|uniref:DUF6059 family protein n=1 Tax=unclassified Streptomyces TaxID=2593676 RepID=UPI0036B05D5E
MTVARRLLAQVGHALAAAGWIWVGLAGAGTPPPPRPEQGPPLRPPPRGHPERLRPDIPLTCTERHIERELTGLTNRQDD